MTAQPRRFATGIPGLDDILKGGFVEGASYIIQGKPGAGKTIFANQIAFASVAAGRKVLYVTLLAETHDRLFQSLSTIDFFDKNELGANISYVSVFQTLRDEGLSAVVSLLREETARKQATLLVFDGLLNARDRADTDLDVKTFVAEVQNQAAFVGCTVLFLASARDLGENPEHTMVDGVLELKEEVVGVRSARRLQVRKSRASDSLGGLHTYEISSKGITLYPRLEAALGSQMDDEGSVSAPVGSGIEGLDDLLGGGLPEASVTLAYGPTGSGKTSLGLSFLGESNETSPGLLFGFYETPGRLRLKARTLGLDFNKLIEAGHLEVVWQRLGENILDKLAYRLLDAVSRRNVKRLVIDGLGGFDRAATAPHRLLEFYAALTAELRAKGVTTIATWELRELFGPSLTMPGPEISAVLDNLIMLRNVEMDSQYTRVLSVIKVRDSDCSTQLHRVDFSKQGLKVVAPLAPVAGAMTGIATSSEG